MKNTSDMKNVVVVYFGDGSLLWRFKCLRAHLQKALAGYIVKNRVRFPHFDFVSDPIVLEIRDMASDTHTIQHHIQFNYDNLVHLDIITMTYDKIPEYLSNESLRNCYYTVPHPKQLREVSDRSCHQNASK